MEEDDLVERMCDFIYGNEYRLLMIIAERVRGDERLNLLADQIHSEMSNAAVTKMFSASVEERGEWAGAPRITDVPLILEPRYPYQGLQGMTLSVLGGKETVNEPDEADGLVDAAISKLDIQELNRWVSHERNQQIVVVRVNGKSRAWKEPHSSPYHRWAMQLETLGCYLAWRVDAEIQAMWKLRELVTVAQFACYVLTGSFLEKSERSNVVYCFRRLRPTVAIMRTSHKPDAGLQARTALCLHPVGHYSGSHGGTLVPTDDVIAHLLLMRGDEHAYWRQANQISVFEPNSGI